MVRLQRASGIRPRTLGGDKAYDTADCPSSCSSARPVGCCQLQPSCLRSRRSARVVFHPALLIDQHGDPPCGPQTRVEAQRLGSALEAARDLLEPYRGELRLAPGARGLLQPGTSVTVSCSADRFTDCRCTPSCRATSTSRSPAAQKACGLRPSRFPGHRTSAVPPPDSPCWPYMKLHGCHHKRTHSRCGVAATPRAPRPCRPLTGSEHRWWAAYGPI